MYINKLYVNHPDRLDSCNLISLVLVGLSSMYSCYTFELQVCIYYLSIHVCLGRFRQYGLWERYTDLYPDNDLVYTVGVSDYSKDWFYAQVTR